MSHVDAHSNGAVRTPLMRLSVQSLSEDRLGPKWRAIFRHGWLGWNEWFQMRGSADAPRLEDAIRALRRHMPEIVPLWQRMVELAGGDEDAARFLTFWSPPRYLVNCSQAVFTDQDGPVLARNYDLDPALNEGRLLKTAWLGRDVIGMVEGMAGLSDGMNAAGLAISLSFGGRAAKGRGFGIPLILRYVLEICTDVADAVEVLRAVPCHMAYNVTVVDHEGNHATVMLSPDRPPIVTDARATTNHQLGNEWPKYARHTRTLEREKHLQRALAAPYLDRAGFERLFLTAPLHSQRYGEGFGTVYTAVYRPAEGTMRLAWPGLASMDQSFSGFTETARTLAFTDGAPPTEASDDVAGNDRLWDVFHQRNEDHDLGSWHNLNSTALVQEQETSK